MLMGRGFAVAAFVAVLRRTIMTTPGA